MAHDTGLLNLRDMVAIVTNRDLQTRFVRFHAPDIKINWGGFEGMSGPRRAEAIVGALEEGRDKDDTTRLQHDNLFRNLRTVALVNADSDSAVAIQSLIDTHRAFKGWFVKLDEPPCDPANLAVLVNLAANAQFGSLDNAAVADAKEIWKDIVNKAASELKYQKFSPGVQFNPSPASEKERARGLADFENEFRRHLVHSGGMREPLVAVHVVRTSEHSRYLVTTSPLPRNVSKENREKKQFEIGKDDQARTFEIVIDEVHCLAHASATPLIGAVRVIEMFLKCVLKTAICPKKKLSYERSLQMFRDPGAFDKLTLPYVPAHEGAKWIERLDVRLRENLLPVSFHGDERRNVYSEIEAIVLKEFPRENWIVTGAVIKVRLPPGGGPAGERSKHPRNDDAARTYPIVLREKSLYIDKNKTFNRSHLRVLEAIPEAWGFKGLNVSQKAIGVGEVSLERRLPGV